MKNIFKSLIAASCAFAALVACTPDEETISTDIPVAADYEDAVVISVDQSTNVVTFTLSASGVTPVWYVNGDTTPTSTVNGYQQTFASAGEYYVDVKIRNSAGVSDGSIHKTFTIENTLVDNTMYTTYLAGSSTRSWSIASSKAGHLACGPDASDPTSWWSASANDKAGTGLYECVVTFDVNGNYTITPSEQGIYVNYGTTALNTTGATADFALSVEEQTVAYSIEVEGEDIYLVFPANTYFPYIANDDIYENPRYKIVDISSKSLTLVSSNDDIAWQYILKATDAVETFEGYDETSEYNMWTEDHITGTFFYYATTSSWVTHDDPTYSYADGVHTTYWADATSDRWQAQFHIYTDISTSADTNYDFSCILNLNKDHEAVMVKLVDMSDDGVYYFASTIACAAYEDVCFYRSNMDGIDIASVKLVLDFGYCADETTAVVKNIVLKDHANDDGREAPEQEEEVEEEVVEDGLDTWVADGTNLLAEYGDVIYFWYSDSSWTQIDDPEHTYADGAYTITFPYATSSTWMAQTHMEFPNTATSAANKYDFKVSLTSDQSFDGATVKLTSIENENSVYYFASKVALEAGVQRDFVKVGMDGLDIAEGDLKLVIDFGGNPAETTIVISDIVLQVAQ